MGKAKIKAEVSNPYEFSQELYSKLDIYQRNYAKAIRHKSVVFVDAPSGTGKTTIALLVGMELLAKGAVQKIVYLRFPDDRYLKQGFLPGNPEQKAEKLYGPFFDALTELDIGEKQFQTLVELGHIELTTDMALRGTNMRSVFLIIDEAQNAKDIEDLKLALTRLRDSSKAVVIGHTRQTDNKRTQNIHGLTPFQLYAKHMTQKSFAVQCDLINNYRGEISRWADSIHETVEKMT